MKVLVLEPPNQGIPVEQARPNGSLGPAYLVAALREQGIEADYLDGTVGTDPKRLDRTFYNVQEQENGLLRYGMSEQDLAESLAQYDVIATSSIFTAQTRMHLDVARIVRQLSAQRGRPIHLISGGVNARSLRNLFLGNGFDIIALGEGEEVIVRVVREFGKPNPDFSSITGISYRKGDTVVDIPAGPQDVKSSLDHLPLPAWDALPLDIYHFLETSLGGSIIREKFTQVQTSRGCQDKCTFCHISWEKANSPLVGKIGFLREFSKERLQQMVRRAVDLGCKRLYLVDENIFYNKRRICQVAPYLRHDGLAFSDTTGANLRFLLRKESNGNFVVDGEFIDVLADFGLEELGLPFETHSAELMRKYASGKYDPDRMDSVAIVHALKKRGITLRGEFMIGFRDEPWESVVRTKELAKKLVQEGLDSAGFQVATPYPGSLDFEEVMKDPVLRETFDRDTLYYTDRMHTRGRPVFPTQVPAARLEAAVHEFWLEVNGASFTQPKMTKTLLAMSAARREPVRCQPLADDRKCESSEYGKK